MIGTETRSQPMASNESKELSLNGTDVRCRYRAAGQPEMPGLLCAHKTIVYKAFNRNANLVVRSWDC
jgi:hypothetical protein